jgi:hypothetical protein
MKSKMLVILLLLWPIGINAADQLNLKLNLEPKTSFLYTMDVKQTRVQTVENEQQSLSQEMLEAWSWDINKQEKSGDMILKLTHKRIMINQDYDGQKTNYDSDVPPAYLDPSMRGLASMPGTVLTVKVTPQGKVAQIDGVETMLDKMIKAMALPDPNQKNAVITDLRKQWGTEAMKQSLEQITSFYPDKPIAVDDQWDTNFDITSGGLPMHINSHYTLKSRSDGTAFIDATSDISSDSATSTVSMGPLTMVYNIKGNQSGTLEVDEATGLPSKSNLIMHYDGTVTVSGVPDQEPKTWPISADGSVLITFVRQ